MTRAFAAGALVANGAVRRSARIRRAPRVPLTRGHQKMRIASSLSVLSALVLSACGGGMETAGPAEPLMSAADAAQLDRSSTQTVGQVFTMSNAVSGNSV